MKVRLYNTSSALVQTWEPDEAFVEHGMIEMTWWEYPPGAAASLKRKQFYKMRDGESVTVEEG